jgi:hypothetical protein
MPMEEILPVATLFSKGQGSDHNAQDYQCKYTMFIKGLLFPNTTDDKDHVLKIK